MNICGILVHAFPEKVDEVAVALGRMPGVELHGHAHGSRLIVTVEDTDGARALDSLAAIHTLPGIVAAALVYHHHEPEITNAGAHVTENRGP